MKNLVILISCFIVYSFGYGQVFNEIDEITPFHENFSAIKKNKQWAFINREGVKVINFRGDIVSTTDKYFLSDSGIISVDYPLFKDGKCLIKKLIDGVYYYGYIDENGKEIIAPQYVNATNFTNGYAIVIKFAKNIIGKNNVLGKRVVIHKLEEYIIDSSGNLVKYLDNSRSSIPSEIKNETPPSFYSKIIAPYLVAVKNKDKKWNIYKF